MWAAVIRARASMRAGFALDRASEPKGGKGEKIRLLCERCATQCST